MVFTQEGWISSLLAREGVIAQESTHPKMLILCCHADIQFSGQNSPGKAEFHQFCPEANSLV